MINVNNFFKIKESKRLSFILSLDSLIIDILIDIYLKKWIRVC